MPPHTARDAKDEPSLPSSSANERTLTEYRITQLELRASGNEQDAKTRKSEVDKVLGDLKRDTETTNDGITAKVSILENKLDVLVAKLTVWATIVGLIAGVAGEYIALKLSGK